MKFSFPVVIKLFYFSLLIVILALIYLTSIESLEAQYQNANLKARQLNKNEISKLHEILNLKYEKLLKQLEKEVILSGIQIRELQKQNIEKNRQLNQKYLHPSEYLSWQNINFNTYESPLLLLSFQLSKSIFEENLANLNKWSQGTHSRSSKLNFDSSAFMHSDNKQISDLNFKFSGDANKRSISLSNDDIVKFKKIDKELNGELSKNIIEAQLIRILIDQFTWSIPNTIEELQQCWPQSVHSTQVGTATIKELIPMLTVAGYMYSQNSLFGQIPHHYIDMATKVFQDDLNSSESILRTNLNQWDFLSYAFFGDSKTPTSAVLPQNVTLLKIDKSWLIRSIAARTIEELKLKNILIEFKDYKLKNNYLKLDNRDKAVFLSGVNSIKNFEEMTKKNWKLTSPQEWVNSTHIFTSKVLQLGAPIRIYRWHSKSEIRESINRSIFQLFLAVITIILSLVLITKTDLKIVHQGIQNCMDLIMSRKSPSDLEGQNELHILAKAIQLFNQRILWRKQSTKLKRRILQITNIPRLKPHQYLEEFQYACKDISERFKFKIDSDRNITDKNISISIGTNWQKSLKLNSNTIDFSFQGPLEEHEIDHLHHDLQVLVDRSEIQSQLIRSDQLGADLELSKTLQKVLDPIHHFSLEPPHNFEATPLLIRSNHMLFDAMDRADAGQKVNLYHIDMSTRGLSSALLASSFKSSLHSLLQLDMTPAKCLAEFNQMILDQNIDDLLVSCAILQIDHSNNKLNFSSAGHSGLYRMENQKYVSLHRSNIPLGITTNYDFKDYIQELRSGDYCFFGNGVHASKKLPNTSYFDESNSLKVLTEKIIQNLNINDLQDDYCAWFLRIP